MNLKILANSQQTVTAASTTQSSAQGVHRAKGYCACAQITNTTPTAQTFTANDVTMAFTATAHGMLTGLVVQVSESGGALPTGLAPATNYYVTNPTANTFQLATSLVNALAGTNLTISSNGSGTLTVTPTALAGGVVSIYASIDGIQPYCQIANSSFNVTATGNFIWNVDAPYYEYIKINYALTAGQISSVQNIVVKGYQ